MAIAKIYVCGAGNVGAACAAAMTARSLGNVFLYDVVEDLAVGKAMDINQASPFFHGGCRVTGCNSLEDLEGSDVVVITAGSPRRAGMDRKDLLRENLDVAMGLGGQIERRCPRAKVLLVTNPVEPLTWALKRHWPTMNVFGLGCSLDSLRLRFFLAEASHTSVESVSAIVIGTHDNYMVPLLDQAAIGGIAVNQLLGEREIAQVVARTKEAGTAIVKRLKTRGSFYAASFTVAEIVEAIVRHTGGIFPVSVLCDGQYGYRDICLALPSILGEGGVEKIVQPAMGDTERQALAESVRNLRESLASMNMG